MSSRRTSSASASGRLILNSAIHRNLSANTTRRPSDALSVEGCRFGGMPFVVEVEGGRRDRLELTTPERSLHLERNIAMSKVVAIMSMSLDGYVADPNDGVAEVFDWYIDLGGRRDPHRRLGPHDVQRVRAERRAPPRSHVRARCRAHRSAHVRRRPGLGRKSRVGTGIRPHPSHPRRMAATRLDRPLRDRRHRERREPGQSRRRREVRRGPRRRHHPAVPECRPPRRAPHRHRGGASWLRSSTLRSSRRHASRPWQPQGDPGRRRHAPALPGPQA